VVTTDFPPMVSSAASARRWVAGHLQRWELAEQADVAALLASELVANAIVHTGSGPTLVLAIADGVIDVGVTDNEPRLPRAPRPPVSAGSHEIDPSLLAEGGRGLFLVEALADEWGAATVAGGKQVWFRLDAQHWSYRSACACNSGELDRVRLGSGRCALAIPGPWDIRSA
jgi:anti-sigma regulatory factor (Ser/Thr protein kinase)